MVASEIGRVAARLSGARKVVALTGAGISTDSGIPDFRGPNGVWTRDPAAEKLATLQNYMEDRNVRVQAWQTRLEHPAWTALPGPGHLALAELQRRGKVDVLITQNIDGLHHAAGMDPATIVEIHGSMREVVCMSCGERAPMQRALDRVRRGENDPSCRSCGGILKSATISFGQSLVEADLEAARRAAMTCELFLAIGTSLSVFPVAYLPQVAIDHGARLAVFNGEPTQYDGRADAVISGPLARTLPQLVELVAEG